MRRFTCFFVRKTPTWAQKRIPGYQGLPEFARCALTYRRRRGRPCRSPNLCRLPQLIPIILFSSAPVIKLIAIFFLCGRSARLALITVGWSSGKIAGCTCNQPNGFTGVLHENYRSWNTLYRGLAVVNALQGKGFWLVMWTQPHEGLSGSVVFMIFQWKERNNIEIFHVRHSSQPLPLSCSGVEATLSTTAHSCLSLFFLCRSRWLMSALFTAAEQMVLTWSLLLQEIL